ncbi:hypothetical protein GCM10008942_11470 [Rhizomicrobium electricum]|uniref:Uncharacterized protein n=1 Tax=Rhizomicrobium electricum TaxID=480070 RepID=A0ABN1EEF2_9PROT|nr:hypothetical protein [Rhizomicrobium electricum]
MKVYASILVLVGCISSAGAAGCIDNSYPGHDKFCLTSKQDANYYCHGAFQWHVVHLKIQCNAGTRNAGAKWNISCLDDGSKCNLNDQELCRGLTQWNVGDHCTQGGSTPNG